MGVDRSFVLSSYFIAYSARPPSPYVFSGKGRMFATATFKDKAVVTSIPTVTYEEDTTTTKD